MNFTKSISNLLGRVRNLMRGQPIPVKLNTVVERQLETAKVAESQAEPKKARRAKLLTRHTRARCRCASMANLPVWCPRHRCYVYLGAPDRPVTKRSMRGRFL